MNKILSLCMIVRDCGDDLDKCLKSCYNIFDEIIIVDTGSKDNTKDVAYRYTNNVFDFAWIDDFAAARNFSFSKATSKYIMWLDSDDHITPQNYDKLLALKNKELSKSRATSYVLRYNYGPSTRQWRRRIVVNTPNTKWLYPIHEIIDPNLKNNGVSVTINREDIEIDHNIKPYEKRGDRNLRILEKAITGKYRDNPRIIFYLAREYYYRDEFKAIIYLLESNIERIEKEDEREANYMLATSFRKTKRDFDALEVCERVWLKHRDYDEFIQMIKDIRKKDPWKTEELSIVPEKKVVCLLPVHESKKSKELLPKFLSSFFDSGTENAKLVILNNGCGNWFYEIIMDYCIDIRENVIDCKENIGFIKAINKGIKETESDYVVVLNTDIVMQPGWLSSMYKEIVHSGVGMVGFNHRRYNGIVSWLEFCCVMIKRKSLDFVGDLDERFGIGYFEDDDLCLRMLLNNWTLRSIPAKITHFPHSSTPDYRKKISDNYHKFTDKWKLHESDFVKKYLEEQRNYFKRRCPWILGKEPKYGAIYCAYNEYDLIQKSIRSVYDHVDIILVSIGIESYDGHSKQEENKKMINAVHRITDPKRKIRFVMGNWKTEASQRNDMIEMLTKSGHEYSLVVDADEIWEEKDLVDLKAVVSENPNMDGFRCNMYTYWKDVNHRIDPPEDVRPVVIVKNETTRFVRMRECKNIHTKQELTYQSNNCLVLRDSHIKMHHLSYVRTDEELRVKMGVKEHTIHGDKNGSKFSDWYKEKWLGWNEEMEDLHPVRPAQYKKAVRVINIPEVLK